MPHPEMDNPLFDYASYDSYDFFYVYLARSINVQPFLQYLFVRDILPLYN